MRTIPLIAFLVSGVFALLPPGAQQGKPSSLRIVVVSGEDAVNIIQQRTAVSPIVEVRDRNDQPVAGAVVTFAIQGSGHATFAGASSVTATTNALGQAVAAGFTPTSAGAVQINVAAVFQGQSVTAAITQTNVLSAAEAAAAAGTGAGAPGTGASGGGGGPGAGTYAAVAGAVAGVAGGYLVYEEQTKKEPLPPELGELRVEPQSGVAALTRVRVNYGFAGVSSTGSMSLDFGDATVITWQIGATSPFLHHIYQSPGSYTIRLTLTDAQSRSLSREGSVVITSLTGRWTATDGTGVLTITQQGPAFTGLFTTPAGVVCTGITGSATTPFEFEDGQLTLVGPRGCPPGKGGFDFISRSVAPNSMSGVLWRDFNEGFVRQ